MGDSTNRRARQYRFGPFELDVRAGELRKRGIRLHLREQVLQLLLLLLEHPGEIVLRDEIRFRLWPNETVVEFDNGINTAIRRLRNLLGESAEKPRYVETVARRGYRFMAEVETVYGSPSEPLTPDADLLDVANLVGKLVSHYEVLSELGRGGMGVVFRAKDLNLDRNVALKFLPKEYSKHPQLLERFQREARAAAALNHPGICTIYEIGEHQRQPFIAMELLEGQTLKDRLTGSPLPAGAMVSLAVQIAEALDAAHAGGIVHRDLKPANVFITQRGRIKILDFGLAKLLREHTFGAEGDPAISADVTTPGVPVGTMAYMSPEQVRGEAVDRRSDIFSLGVVLYEMLSGKKAFGGRTSNEVRDSILECDPPDLPPTVPALLGHIVCRCLEKEPERRFQSAADLAIALNSSFAHVSMAGMGKPETLGPPPSTRFNSIRTLGAATCTLLLVVAAVAWRYARNMTAGGSEPQWDSVQVSELTATGQVWQAALSPDGRFVVYVSGNEEESTLRLRNLNTGADSEVGAVGGLKNTGLAVSPDGQLIYFIEGPDFEPGTLYKIPVKGGVPVAVATGVGSAPSFEPGGSAFIFSRDDGQKGEDQIVEARGGRERIVARVRFPLHLHEPAWSPQKSAIAYAATPRKFMHWKLMTQTLAPDSPAREITSRDWYRIDSVAWIDHGDAILFEVEDTPNAEHQIWKVTYPEGGLQRVTADLNSYHGLSLSNDSKLLVSLYRRFTSQIFVMRVDSRAVEDIQQITRAGPSRDGWDGLAFTSDGRLVLSSAASGADELWAMDADGSHKQQLTKTDARNMRVSLSRDGQIMICGSNRGGDFDIWRMNSDGTNARQLTTTGTDSLASVSPDGTWIAYLSMRDGKRRLWKMDVNGANQAKISDTPMLPEAPAISPDGTLIAFMVYAPEERSNQILVIRADGGKPIQGMIVPRLSSRQGLTNQSRVGPVQWTPAGDAVAYVQSYDGVDNIWAQPVAGGAARQVTHFREGRIYRFAWSWSGKQMALVRGNTTSDAVLLRPIR